MNSQVPPSIGMALFESAIGTMAAAWGPGGLTRIRLPEASEIELVALLSREVGDLPEARPPTAVARAKLVLVSSASITALPPSAMAMT